MNNIVLFAVFPYLAVIIAIIGTIYRYFDHRFSYSSLSSQLLESRWLFWGSVTWHYSIITILLAHLLAALFPSVWQIIISEPLRLYTMEITGWALGILSIIGCVFFIARRMTNPRVRAVTSIMDWVLLLSLLGQVILGVWVAMLYRWGAAWYLFTAVPWFFSLLTLNPQVDLVANLPLIVQLHILGGFWIFALLPFSRLVHILPFPITYLWRPYQVVVWNRR